MEKNPIKITLSESIYEKIRRDIIANQLRPGERIRIKELCERYEASETPVRLALNRLTTENIIEHSPRQGMRVKTINLSLCEETFDMRLILECSYLASVIMTLNVNERMHIELQRNVEENLALVQTLTSDSKLDVYLEIYEYDIAFHHLLIKCSGNKLLMELYQFLNPFLYVNYVYSKQSSERLLAGIHEHAEILGALFDGDEVKAKAAVATHLTNAKRVIISILKIENIL